MRITDVDILPNRIIFHTDFDMETKKAIEDEIQNAPGAEFGKWIPCSERLPSEGYTPVLISGYIEEVNYNSVQIARYRNGTWWYCDGSQEPVISKVTAWMPLPPVYQGGESE